MKLTNIYKNLIYNIETYVLNSILELDHNFGYSWANFIQWKKYDDKYQIVLSNEDDNRYNQPSHIIYQSPKYQRYQYVVVFALYGVGHKISKLPTFKNPEYIDNHPDPEYNKINNIPKYLQQVYNPDQLDLYYDTIFTYNEFNQNAAFSAKDEDEYWKFFGDEILNLLIIPDRAVISNEYYNLTDRKYYDLYYKSIDKLTDPQYILDIPENINTGKGGEVVLNESNEYVYNYEAKYLNMHFSYSMTTYKLETYNIYNSLHKVFNYLDNYDNLVDLVSINDEISFLLNKASGSQYIDVPMFIHNNKGLLLNPKKTINIESFLGTELYNLIQYAKSNYYKTNTFKYLEATTDGTNVEKIFNYGAYLYFDKILDNLDSQAIRSLVQNKKYENINEIIEPVIFDEYNNCQLVIDGEYKIFRKSTIFDNSFIKISEKRVVSYYEYRVTLGYGSNTEAEKLGVGIDIEDSINSVKNTVSYIIGKYTADTTTLVSFNIDEKQHVDFINFNPVYGRISPYSTFLDQEDSTIANRLELINYDLLIKNFKVNDTILKNVIINDPDRFMITGISIDLDNSKSSDVLKVLNSSFDLFVENPVIKLLRFYAKNDKIRFNEYPLPLMANTFSNFFNVNTSNTCNTINTETKYTKEYIDNMYRTGFDFIEVRNDMNALMDDTGATIGAYDRATYNLYNKAFGNFDLLQFRNQTNLYVIFMIIDKYTGKKDFMQVDLMNDPITYVNQFKFITHPFYDKESKMLSHIKENFYYDTTKQFNAFFSNYENDPYNEQLSFKSSLIANSKYSNTFPVYMTDIVIKNGNYLNGQIDQVIISNAKALLPDNTTFVILDATIDYADFIVNGYDLSIDLSSLFGTYKVLEYIDIEIKYSKLYKTFDYLDQFSIIYNFNIFNFKTTQQYGVRASFVGVGATSINHTRMNVRPPKNIECLPQEVYNESIAAEIFDIDDYIQNYVPDDKLCILLNNFIGNNYNNNLSLSTFDTTGFDITDLSIIDRTRSNYVKYTNQYKKLPFLTSNENVNKYVRVYVDAKLPIDSTNIFEQFEFYNLYNPSLVNSLGVLFMEGQLSDYTNGMDFSDVLKIYRTELIQTIQHNVVNTMLSPLLFDITCKIYENKSNYESDTDGTILPTINDFFNIKIYNRGDHIKQTSEQYPRLLNHIEYYEINPEYSQQEKKDYIYTIEYKLLSDHPDIKVSELFFDVLFMTDDLLIGIPVDYTNVPDPIHAIDIKQTTDKEEILYYFNWLIRYMCPNCTNAHIAIKVKIMPSLFGYNVSNFTIGAYMHNVKLEERIPYIFYKESADALMILDKKTDMDVDRIILPKDVRENLQSTLHGDSPLTMGDPEYLDLNEYCGTVSMPKNTKVNQLVFNSSIYPKRLIFTLESNSSSKIIYNTSEDITFPPFDFKIITFEETVALLDYTGGFSGGIATYKVEEVSVHNDTTVELLNEKMQLIIPAYDEAMSRIMSFMDKSAKLVTLKYKKNDNIDSIESIKNTGANQKTSNIRVARFVNDIDSQEKYGQLLDFDRRFYIEQAFEVILDKKAIANFIPFFKLFDPQLQLKVPISKPKFVVDASIEERVLNIKDPIYTKILQDSTGVNEDFNNYYDLSNDYLFMIGTRTDINKFTFTLSGFIYYENNDLLHMFTRAYYDKGLYKFGFRSEKRMFNPLFLLEMLFGSKGNDIIQYTIDNFILGAPDIFSDYDKFTARMITEVGDRQGHTMAEGTGSVQSKSSIFDTQLNFSSMSTLDRSASLNILTSEKILKCYARNTGSITSLTTINEMFSTPQGSPNDEVIIYQNAMVDVGMLYQLFFSTTLSDNDLVGVIEGLSKSGWVIPTDTDSGQEGQTFDKVYDILNNTLFSRFFTSGNLINLYIELMRSETLAQPMVYNCNINVDGRYDAITTAYVGDENTINDVGYIDPKSDKFKLFTKVVPIKFEFNTMNQVKLNIKLNDQLMIIENILYPVKQELDKRLLSKPLKILVYAKKYKIIQDSNYKLQFSIPIEIFKGINSYMSIDKIKVVDNYISSNDFHVTFGTLNERFSIKGSGELQINKILNKFESGIRIKLEVFNIANTTGAYNTSLLIYYSLNGTQFVEEFDIIYDIVLPNVLDNEYLLIDIDRLDYSPPTYSKKVFNRFTGKWETVTSFSQNTTFESYYNPLLGSPGCDLGYPDFVQHNTEVLDDSMDQLKNRPTGTGFTANLDDYKDL